MSRQRILFAVPLAMAVAWTFALPAQDVRQARPDVDAGGRIEAIRGGKRFLVQQRTDSVPGRAELRGPSSMTAVTAGGRFRLIAGGRWLSILQVLNVTAAGERGGAAKPVSQLAIRLNPGSARYQFFIVQGAQRCLNVRDLTIGTTHRISVSAKAGGDPEYSIDGVRCAPGNPEGNKAGMMRDAPGLAGRHYFYAKLGAYQTLSNQRGQGGSSIVEWTDIAI